jgi:hypothetical protein
MKSKEKEISKQGKYWKYFDESWKKIIEFFFPQFLRFFVPELYLDIDFSKGVYFLDKEMEQLSKGSRKGAKYVDKLVKICLKDGGEQWILIHIEIQGYSDRDFSQRMFRYFYRIFDKYNEKIVSIALMTSSGKDETSGRFEFESYDSGVVFRYRSYRLMDYDSDELKESDNPIALVVWASQEKELAKRKGEKFNAKLRLIKAMYGKGYTKDEVIALFEFIDWILELSVEEEYLIREEIKKIEGVKNMPYVNSVKRWGIKVGLERGLQRGLKQGLQQATRDIRDIVIEVLDERFGEVPSDLVNAINKIEEINKLKSLGRIAVRCDSLQDFAKSLNE